MTALVGVTTVALVRLVQGIALAPALWRRFGRRIRRLGSGLFFLASTLLRSTGSLFALLTGTDVGLLTGTQFGLTLFFGSAGLDFLVTEDRSARLRSHPTGRFIALWRFAFIAATTRRIMLVATAITLLLRTSAALIAPRRTPGAGGRSPCRSRDRLALCHFGHWLRSRNRFGYSHRFDGCGRLFCWRLFLNRCRLLFDDDRRFDSRRHLDRGSLRDNRLGSRSLGNRGWRGCWRLDRSSLNRSRRCTFRHFGRRYSRSCRRFRDGFVTLDEHALLAHFHLHRASPTL